MELVFNLLAFIFTICFLILTHECGHFFVARIFKVKILKFSIGFGKAIFKWKDKLGIEYVIAWLPLGGYVKMLDTREMKVKPNELHLALDKKPFLQKMLIVFAGPLTNVLFGVLVFWLIFVIGIKSPKPIIGAILPNSIASSAGLLAKDQIVAVDGKKAVNWQDVMLPLFSHLGDKDKITLGVVRSHENTPHNYDLDLVNWEVNPVDFDLFHDLGIEPYHPFIPQRR
jgi:regulator of sigma E protease